MTRLRTSCCFLAGVLLVIPSVVRSQDVAANTDASGTEKADARVGYYPTLQSSTSTMSYLPGWEPTANLSPTSPSYGQPGSAQSSFGRGFDRFLNPLVPNEAAWNSSVYSGHFTGYEDGYDGHSPLGITSVRANSGLWLDRSFDPRMAEIKVGPLYLDFNYLEAVALWSDINGPFASRVPDDGFIAMFGLNVSAFIQITSQTYLKAIGTLYYVPTSNQVGFYFGSGGATYAEIEHFFSVSRWDVHLYDRFDVFTPLSYLLSDLSRPAFDQSGLYRVGLEYAFTSSPWKGDYLYFRNIAGVEATTYFAHDFRFRMGYEHWESWLSDNFDRLTPVDHLSAGLFYENNVFWFRPWLTYDGYFYDSFTDSIQQVYVGANLPFSRSLIGFARAGYAWSDGGLFGTATTSGFVWDVGLTQYINSSWSHTAQTGYSAQIGPLAENTFGYYAEYLIRYQPPRGRISTNALVQWQRNEFDASHNWLAGAQLTYSFDPKTSFDAYVYYWDHLFDDGVNSEAWLYRLQFSRNLSSTLLARLIYQFTDYRTTMPNSDYTDHMLMLSLTKYF